MIFIVGRIHHPVNHVHAMMIESAHCCAERCHLVTRSHNHVLRFFGLKSDIALGGRTLIIEVGECGHAECHVPRSRKAPAVGGAIREVDTRIPAETAVERSVHVSHHTHRQREIFEQDVMLGKVAHVGAIVALVVVAVFARNLHIFALLERTSEVGGKDALVAHLGAERSGAGSPIEIAVEATAIHVAAVEVFAHVAAMN